jgi:hypothetical protein
MSKTFDLQNGYKVVIQRYELTDIELEERYFKDFKYCLLLSFKYNGYNVYTDELRYASDMQRDTDYHNFTEVKARQFANTAYLLIK